MTFEGFESDTWEALPGASRLTIAQREAIESDEPLLCVVAGAGAGKTRVLTLRVARRVRDGSIEPDRTLVTTFSRKAAEELRTRLCSLGVSGVQGGHLPPHGAGPAARAPRAARAPAAPAAAGPPPPAGRGDDGRSAPDPRPRRGDRLGQGAARVARALRGRGPASPAAQRHEHRAGGRRLRPLRGGAVSPAAARLRRSDRRLRGRAGRRPRVRRLHPLAHPAPLRRRDAGREPGPVPPAHRHARRRPRPLRRGRPQPVGLRVQRRRPDPARTGCPRSSGAPRSSAWTRTTAARRRWWRSRRPCSGRALRSVRGRRGAAAHDAGRRAGAHGRGARARTRTRRRGRRGGPSSRARRVGGGRASPC